jgi:hypothetical protein
VGPHDLVAILEAPDEDKARSYPQVVQLFAPR